MNDELMELIEEYGRTQYRAGQLHAALERNIALLQRLDRVSPMSDPLATMRKAEELIAAGAEGQATDTRVDDTRKGKKRGPKPLGRWGGKNRFVARPGTIQRALVDYTIAKGGTAGREDLMALLRREVPNADGVTLSNHVVELRRKQILLPSQQTPAGVYMINPEYVEAVHDNGNGNGPHESENIS